MYVPLHHYRSRVKHDGNTSFYQVALYHRRYKISHQILMINNKLQMLNTLKLIFPHVFFFFNLILGNYKAEARVTGVLGKPLQLSLAASGRRSPCDHCRVNYMERARLVCKVHVLTVGAALQRVRATHSPHHAPLPQMQGTIRRVSHWWGALTYAMSSESFYESKNL